MASAMAGLEVAELMAEVLGALPAKTLLEG
jgi:hypothetical protein